MHNLEEKFVIIFLTLIFFCCKLRYQSVYVKMVGSAIPRP